MSAIDVNRGTSGVALPEILSREVWGKTVEDSAILRLAQRINLPGAGLSVNVIASEPEASFVGETEVKGISKPTFATKHVKGYTLQVTVPFSNQFKRDEDALYAEILNRLPKALGTKLDKVVFAYPGTSAPGSHFDTFSTTNIDAVSLNNNVYDGLVEAKKEIAVDMYDADGIALSPVGEAQFELAKDEVGRPMFIYNNNNEGSIGSALGMPIHKSRGVYIPEGSAGSGQLEQLGIIGDWNQAVVGIVEGINMSMSDQATLDDGNGGTINLWQRNMFAIRFEMEVGFAIKDYDAFKRLTGGEPAPSNAKKASK